ncbi:hypothetical protein Tco_1458541 [Tanacetum coccineum]
MDRGSRNGIQANEKIDSKAAYVNRTKRERGIDHLPGGNKGSHQCSSNDGKGRETSAYLLRQPCITRSGSQFDTAYPSIGYGVLGISWSTGIGGFNFFIIGEAEGTGYAVSFFDDKQAYCLRIGLQNSNLQNIFI